MSKFALLFTSFCSIWLLHTPAIAQSLLSEDFETYSTGTGTYSGAWSFVHADSAYSNTIQSSLNIGNGSIAAGGPGGGFAASDASPVGGNYLTFTTGFGSWAATQAYTYDLVTGEPISRTFTTNAWESSAGHFYRTLTVEAGQTYQVSLWRQIQTSTFGVFLADFTVWDANALDIVNPFQNSGSNLLANRSYTETNNPAIGGWAEVNLTFTAPGIIGSGTSDIAFMMGFYSPTTPSTTLINSQLALNPEWDGNLRTTDTIPVDWFTAAGITHNERSRYMIDGFTVVPVPEPSAALLACVAGIGALLRRKRCHCAPKL